MFRNEQLIAGIYNLITKNFVSVYFISNILIYNLISTNSVKPWSNHTRKWFSYLKSHHHMIYSRYSYRFRAFRVFNSSEYWSCELKCEVFYTNHSTWCTRSYTTLGKESWTRGHGSIFRLLRFFTQNILLRKNIWTRKKRWGHHEKLWWRMVNIS